MSRHRIFFPTLFVPGQSLCLNDSAIKHVQVLRLQPGMQIELFNGSGNAALAHIGQMGRHSVEVSIIETYNSTGPEYFTHIAIGMPTNERMDWLIEKSTELGVSRITPLMTQRTVSRLNGERAVKRVEHWKGIAQAACAQSGRNQLPLIDLPLSWNDYLDSLALHSEGLNIILSLHSEARGWRDLWPSARTSVTLLCGPEGGFTAEEESAAIEHGFIPASLGPFVLRSETAPISVLAQLL